MKSSVNIRIARLLLESVISDLERPHPYAAERVGFLFARRGSGSPGTTLLIPVEYVAVPDGWYIDEIGQWVGAAINGDAIRSALQQVMQTQLGALHVHLHDHSGRPHFSSTDWRDLPDLARSFQHADPSSIHGALLLSRDAATGAVWPPHHWSNKPLVPRISIVGYPLSIYEGDLEDDHRAL